LENLIAILHEDANLLVVNKPAGLVCHPTKGDEFSSLISRARLYLKSSTLNLQPSTSAAAPKPGKGGGGAASSIQPFLVNRLDRETSGIVLIAKNSETAGELGKSFENRGVQKEYLAIVHGRVRDDHGLIDAPLGKDPHSRVVIKDCVRPDGALSQTEYWVERRFDCCSTLFPLARRSEAKTAHPSTFSLLRLIPRTGRKHQIRIHLAHFGHPIVGDKLYGGDEDLYLALVENRLTDEQHVRLILPHHALHARAIRFTWRGQPVEYSCAPEPWFLDFIAKAQSC